MHVVVRGVDITVVATWGAIASALSLTGGCTMIALFIKHRSRINTLWNRILMQLSCMYILGAITAMLTEVPLVNGDGSALMNHRLCMAQAFMVQWIAPMDLLFNCFMLIALYMRVVHDFRVETVKYLEPAVSFCVWVVPAIVSACVLASSDLYGPAGAWCWVMDDFAARLALLYGWIWGGFVIMLTMQLLMVLHLRKHDVHDTRRVAGAALKGRLDQLKFAFYFKMAFYSVVYMITWTPATVNRVCEAIAPRITNNTTAFSAQMFFVQSGGFLFAVLFVGSRQWQQGVRRGSNQGLLEGRGSSGGDTEHGVWFSRGVTHATGDEGGRTSSYGSSVHTRHGLPLPITHGNSGGVSQTPSVGDGVL